MRALGNRRHVAAAAVTLMIGGLAACGDDDNTNQHASDGGSQTNVSSEACDAFIGVNKGLSQDHPDPEAITRNLDALEANAPEPVADEVQVMVTAGRQVVQTQDFAAFDDDEFVAAETTVDPFMFERCDTDQKVEVTGTDYQFSPPPTSLRAGEVAFLLDNASENGELHEMVLLRRKDGIDTAFDQILALPEDQLPAMVDLIGAASAPAGAQGATWVDLTTGDYAMVCYLPQGATHGADDATGPLHFTLGMQAEFTVEQPA